MKPHRPSSRTFPRWPRANRPEAIGERQEQLRSLSHWDAAHHHVLSWPVPAEVLANFQECLTAHMVLPVGVVGPLLLNLGTYVLDEAGMVCEEGRRDGQIFVPLAHS